MRLIFRFWGVKSPFPFVIWIAPPTTLTTISTPSHALPLHVPPLVFHPQSILSLYRALGSNLPPPLVLRIPASVPQATAHTASHTYPTHAPHILFNPRAVSIAAHSIFALGIKPRSCSFSSSPPPTPYISDLQRPIHIPHSPICQLAM